MRTRSYFSSSAAKKESPKLIFASSLGTPLFISEDDSLLESLQTTSPAFAAHGRRRENQRNA